MHYFLFHKGTNQKKKNSSPNQYTIIIYYQWEIHPKPNILNNPKSFNAEWRVQEEKYASLFWQIASSEPDRCTLSELCKKMVSVLQPFGGYWDKLIL